MLRDYMLDEPTPRCWCGARATVFDQNGAAFCRWHADMVREFEVSFDEEVG